MFLAAGSSISVISNTLSPNPVSSTITGKNKIFQKSSNLTTLKEVSSNNNRSSTSINFRLTKPSTKSSPRQQHRPEKQPPAININSKNGGSNSINNSRKKRERLLRTDTSSSTSTSTSSSAVSALPSPTGPAPSHASSINYPSPPSIRLPNDQYFPERQSIDVVTSSTQSSALNPENNISRPGLHSMRRRATETIGSNSLTNSLRAVFRDNNNHTTAAHTNPSGAGNNTTEQTPSSLPRPSHTSRLLRPSVVRSSTTTTPATPQPNPIPSIESANRQTNGNATEMPSIKFIPHQDQRNSRPSLAFAPMTRTLPDDDSVIKVGRYSERDISPNANNSPSAAPIGFKSKVVSRRHCEFWCVTGQWYVKDVKSSSGTFLNHIRLSQPSTESKPFPINDGDIIQLGMDFRGGEESIFRCVKIRIEVNRGWQKKVNEFKSVNPAPKISYREG